MTTTHYTVAVGPKGHEVRRDKPDRSLQGALWTAARASNNGLNRVIVLEYVSMNEDRVVMVFDPAGVVEI